MEERRRYYRIEDKMNLKYQILDNHIFEEEIQNAKVGYIQQADLRNAYRCIDQRLDILNRQISQKDPLIAEAISLLNKKLSLLEVMLGSETVEDIIDSSQQTVNLSGSGIAFHSETAILEDTPLKLQLVLLPENQYMAVLGRVVSCREQESQHFIIAVDFEGISETNREYIVHHILKNQTLQIRQSSEEVRKNL